MKKLSKLLAVVLIAGSIFVCTAFNGGAVFQSALIPGMGQLSAGGWHKYLGLGLMAAEVTVLHLTFNQISETSSFNKQTRLFKQQDVASRSYDEKMDVIQQWQTAYDNAEESNSKIITWMALAGGIWAVSVIEAIIFVPDKEEEVSTVQTLPHLEIQKGNYKAGLKISKRF